MKIDTPREFDVAVIGGGIGGSVLSSILSRHGVRVLQVEGGSHPRFAIGESTIPETTFGLRNLARRYDVPELENLSNHSKTRRAVAQTCGIKRSFSFVHHRDGLPTEPRDCNQFLTLGPPLGPDSHYFRQDVDAYLFNVAITYGTTSLTNTFVDDVLFDDNGVDVITRDKGTFRAKYVVDAGGMRALLPSLLDLRQEPPYRTRTRTIFTHMVNVPSWDAVGPKRSEHKLLTPMGESTLHHIFEGGWIWVIPFDNHATSTNPLCSVGLSLDIDKYPLVDGLDPETEFWQHIARFPSVEAQLRSARAVRPFMANERNQFSSARVVGDRWCLLPHASDFIDPLFSGGLVATVAALHALGHRLITAVHTDDFDTENFRYVEEWTKKIFGYYDKLVSSSYISFDSFELWNAFHRVWTIGTAYGTNAILEAAVAYDDTKDPAAFGMLERAPYRGVQGIDFPPVASLFEAAVQVMVDYRNGEIAVGDAVDTLYRLIGDSQLAPPGWGLLDPEDHTPAGAVTVLPMLRLLLWGKYRAPAAVRANYFNGGVKVMSKDSLRHLRDDFEPSTRKIRESVRDLFFTWNNDWKRRPAKKALTSAHLSPVPTAVVDDGPHDAALQVQS